jgi:xylulokinase
MAETSLEGYLVLDVGLTNVKAVVLDAAGNPLHVATEGYPTLLTGNGGAEQDPDDWWRAARRALSQVPARVRNDVAGVAVTGHMHALVALGADGTPIRPAMVLGDTRAQREAEQINAWLGQERIHSVIGAEMDPSLPAAKILYLAGHEAESHREAAVYLACKDYVRLRLTGETATDPTDACATGLYDIRAGDWSDELLEAAKVDMRQLPALCDAASLGGSLRTEAAGYLGLPAGIPVVIGAGDDVEILGYGVLGRADVVEHLGTTGALLAPSRPLRFDVERALETYPDPVPGAWVLGGAMTTAGAALEWAMGLLGYRDLASAAGTLRGNSRSEIRFSPHMSGRRFPRRDPAARGIWSGMEMSTTRVELMRAVFTGIAFELRRILERIETLAGGGGDIHCAGGSADLRSWHQFRADVYGRRLILAPGEPTARGSLALLLAGMGRERGVRDAAAAIAPRVDVVEPRPSAVRHASERYQRYRATDEALTAAWRSARSAAPLGPAVEA